jgi:hypothetical protein
MELVDLQVRDEGQDGDFWGTSPSPYIQGEDHSMRHVQPCILGE